MSLLAALLVIAAIEYRDAAFFFVWSAASFAIVATGYGGAGIKVLGKQPNGTLSPLRNLLLFPYLVYTWLVWHLCRILSSEPAFDRIDENLVIGRRLLPREVPQHFHHYIDLTSEFEEPRPIRAQKSYRAFPILDASVPTVEALAEIVSEASQGSVYIHCAQGHGRTGLVALALLLHRGMITNVQDGMQLLQKNRPGLRLNRNQLAFIESYFRRVKSES